MMLPHWMFCGCTRLKVAGGSVLGPPLPKTPAMDAWLARWRERLARGGIEGLGAAGGHGEGRALIEAGGAMGGAERHEIADAFAHRAAGSER